MSRLLACLFLASALLAAADAVDSVNPLIGTQRSRIGYGGTMPFVSPPFAMTNWTPQTRQNKISITSYEYDDPAITGFIGTHQPAIWMGDYGYITLMPQVGELRTTPEARGLAFSHTDEIARPDYYAVSLRTGEGTRIRAEMTATARCAFLPFPVSRRRRRARARRSLPAGHRGLCRRRSDNPRDHRLQPASHGCAPRGRIKLPNFKGYFVVQFQQAPANAATYGLDDRQGRFQPRSLRRISPR